MADEKNIEQKIKLTYETNADQTSKEVGKLSDATEKVTNSQEKNAQSSQKSEQSLKTFKTQIREATQDMMKMSQIYGETSVQAVDAAKKVAGLKDQMQFSKDLVDKYNPDQKFKALGAATQIATTATSGLVSGYALLGGQGEDTTKMLLKVQAAMAFSDSISRLSDLGDQWKVFKTVIADSYASILGAKRRELIATEQQTAAQVIQNIVARANPYILLASIIAAVTIATIAWVSATRESNRQLEKATAAVNTNSFATESLKNNIEATAKETQSANNIEVLRARAYGATDEQIKKLITTQNKLAISTSQSNEKKTYENLLKAQANLADAFATGNEDLIKEGNDAKDKAYDLWRKSSDDYTNSINKDVEFNLESRIKDNEKNQQAEDAAAEKRKQKNEERIAQRKKLFEDLRNLESKYLTDLQNNNDKTDQEKLDRQKERDLAEIEALRVKGANVENLLIYNDEKYQALQAELDLKNKEEKEAKDKEEAEKKTEEDKAKREEALVIEEAILEQKRAIEDKKLDIASKGVAFLSTVFGKSKAMQRAAIIAENAIGIGKMVIDNSRANVGALATPQAIATSGASAAPTIAFNNISTGIGVATSIAATAKALSAVGGGGGGSGGSAPQTPSGGSAPQVGFQNSSENQVGQTLANNVNAQAPIQAFVVSSQVTTAQALDRNRLDGNTI